MNDQNKPKVHLSGRNGNAFAILGACVRAAREAKWSEERIKEFDDEAKSGDYDHLLRVCMKWFDVV